MKQKIIWVLVLTFVISICSFHFVFAATKQDVLSAINATYDVAGKKYRLPQDIINQGVEFLNNNELTSEQYDTIMWGINSAVAVAREEGTTNRKKMSEEGMRKLMYIASEVSLVTDVDLDEALEENNIVIDNPTTPVPEKKPVSTPIRTPTPSPSKEAEPIIIVEESGEASGEIVEEISGEKESSGEEVVVKPSSNTSSGTAKSYKAALKEADKKASRNIKIGIGVVILILFINILIICLLFKTKWNKIFKYIVIVIFVLLILVLLIALITVLVQFKRIHLMYRLYLMFN